jgi:hypothetical protein
LGKIIFFVVVVGGIASVFLLIRRQAAKNSRRLGLPTDQRTASFVGGMTSSTFDGGPGTIKLEFFDWGIRLRGAGNLRGFGMLRLLVPVWDARYEELTEARAVIAPTNQGVRLRAAGSAGPMTFWTRRGSEVLDRLHEHAVSVDRAAHHVSDPPPIRHGGSPY